MTTAPTKFTKKWDVNQVPLLELENNYSYYQSWIKEQRYEYVEQHSDEEARSKAVEELCTEAINLAVKKGLLYPCNYSPTKEEIAYCRTLSREEREAPNKTLFGVELGIWHEIVEATRRAEVKENDERIRLKNQADAARLEKERSQREEEERLAALEADRISQAAHRLTKDLIAGTTSLADIETEMVKQNISKTHAARQANDIRRSLAWPNNSNKPDPQWMLHLAQRIASEVLDQELRLDATAPALVSLWVKAEEDWRPANQEEIDYFGQVAGWHGPEFARVMDKLLTPLLECYAPRKAKKTDLFETAEKALFQRDGVWYGETAAASPKKRRVTRLRPEAEIVEAYQAEHGGEREVEVANGRFADLVGEKWLVEAKVAVSTLTEADRVIEQILDYNETLQRSELRIVAGHISGKARKQIEAQGIIAVEYEV